jgi:ribosomal protein S20
MANKDFAAFKAIHVKYGITMNITQDQFTEMIAVKSEMDTLHKKITAALKAGDYTAWKALNKDTPLLSKIDTEAKFKKLIELESYREKMDTIRTELGLE